MAPPHIVVAGVGPGQADALILCLAGGRDRSAVQSVAHRPRHLDRAIIRVPQIALRDRGNARAMARIDHWYVKACRSPDPALLPPPLLTLQLWLTR